MTSKEVLKELYKEREYLLGEKVNNKTKNWHNDITHYDNINHCLLTIKQDLDRLEKLEKATGCPLEVVFKAIEDGIVIIGNIDEYGCMTLWLDAKPKEPLIGEKRDFEEPRLIKFNDWCFSCKSGSYRGCVSLKDYGKTWALSREGLENETSI